MEESLNFSQSLSKESLWEDMSLSAAALKDAAGHSQEAISNEQIHKGDEIWETYSVVSEPISGGMGSIWRVRHKGWNVDLAMKRPQPRFFAEGSQRRKESFIAECEHWVSLGLHPNIVACYYVREIGGVPTIFSEWMEGGSLKDSIQSGALYTGTEKQIQGRILSIAIETARGLRYAHEKGLIHQDVKPGNILLTKDMHAKVGDFGLAKLGEESKAAARKQRVRELMAQHRPELIEELLRKDPPSPRTYTPEYAPHEQAVGAIAAPWMDNYAWALTVLEMYAGKRLWTDGGAAKEQAEALFGQCRLPLPEQLRSLLLNCLQGQEGDLLSCEWTLRTLYRQMTGRPYLRSAARSRQDEAANCNNWALSYVDLGSRENGEKADLLWRRGLEEDPHHADCLFNHTLFQWRTGKLGSIEVLRSLNEVKNKTLRQEMIREIERETKGTLTLADGSPLRTTGNMVTLWAWDGRQPIRGWYEKGFHFTGKSLAYGDFKRIRKISPAEEEAQLLCGAFLDEDRYLLLIYRKKGGTKGWEDEPRVWANYCLVWDCYSGQELMREKLPPEVCVSPDEGSDRWWQFALPDHPENLHFQLGEKAAYRISRVQDTPGAEAGLGLSDRCLNQAEQLYRRGRPVQALRSLERWLWLPGFREMPERVRLQNRIGAALPKTGIRAVLSIAQTTLGDWSQRGTDMYADYTQYLYPEAWATLEAAMRQQDKPGDPGVMEAEFSEDGKRVLWLTGYLPPEGYLSWVKVPQGGAAVVDIETGKLLWMDPKVFDRDSGTYFSGYDNHAHLDRYGHRALFGGAALRIVNVAKGTWRELNGHGPYLSVGFQDEGAFAFCVGADQVLRIIRCADGQECWQQQPSEEDRGAYRIDDDTFAIVHKDRIEVCLIEWAHDLNAETVK